MKLARQYAHSLLFLAILVACFPSVGGRESGESIVSNETTTFTSNVSFSMDIRWLLTILDASSTRRLEVLYDGHYMGTLSEISNDLVLSSGLTMTAWRGESSDEIQQLLKRAVKERILTVMLCVSGNIIKIFEMIRLERLEGHLVKWLLVVEGQEAVLKIIVALEELLYEGTQVIILALGQDRELGVFVSFEDAYGIPRFRYKAKLYDRTSDSRDQLSSLLGLAKEIKSVTNMMGRPMTVASLDIWPFIKFKKVHPDGTVEPTSGTDVMILKTLSQELNFTYRIIKSVDNTWGFPRPDGTATGMVGMVARREVNFALGGNVMNEGRKTVIDYTTWHAQGYLKIFSRAPKMKYREWAVLSPFTVEVWLSIVSSVLAISIILYSESQLARWIMPIDSALPEDLLQVTFSVFRNFVVQGQTFKISRWPHRIVFYSWYIFCLIVAAVYSGMLTAVLAVPEFETPIDSLRQLSKAVADGFTLGVTGESSNEYIFREATEGIYKEVWELFDHKDRSNSFVPRPVVGMKRILERKFIFIWFDNLGRSEATGMGINKFYISRESFFPQNFAIPIPKGVPYKETFSQILMRLVEGGLLTKWQDDEFRKRKKPTSNDYEEATPMAITLNHLQAAFLLLVFGILVSMLVLMLEGLAISLIHK